MCSKLNSWPCALLLVFHTALLQAAPTPYGEDFVRLGAQWDEGGVRWLELAAASNEPEDEQLFLHQLELLEQAAGPYADGLAEPLASLGRHYRQLGDYQQAVSLYQRAMHVVRINDGLNSERQVPLLRELLLSYREMGDLDTLDERYDYFFHLFGNGRPPFTPARIRAAQEYMRWQREAVRRDLDRGKRRLIELIELNENILEELQLQADVPYSWRRDFSYSQMLNHYLLLQRFEPLAAEKQLLISREYMGNQQAAQNLEEQKLDARLRTAPTRVAALLADLALAAEHQGAAEKAAVQLNLADWYFWNGNVQRADRFYAEVVQGLSEAGEYGLLQRWLGEPVELPDNGVFWVPPDSVEDPVVTVAARYDVSARGRVSALQTSLMEEADETSLGSFRRKLSSTLFRPRWVTGEPESVSGLDRRYQLLD